MNGHDPFEELDLQKELNPDNWTDMGTTLCAPTFTAKIRPGAEYTYLWLSKDVFTPKEAQALTRFLVDQGLLPPKEPSLDDFSDFHPQRVDE